MLRVSAREKKLRSCILLSEDYDDDDHFILQWETSRLPAQTFAHYQVRATLYLVKKEKRVNVQSLYTQAFQGSACDVTPRALNTQQIFFNGKMKKHADPTL